MRKLILVLACAIIAGSTIAKADEKLVDLVKMVKPCVVLIETFDKDNKPIGRGSGFFIDNKGSLITNHHVIEGAYSATIKTSAGKEYPVQGIVAKDTEADIVKLVVNLSDANITFLNLSENVPSEGEDIFVIGNPLGLESTVSSGIVSAVRDIPAFGKILQVTAPISPGSSGSPVLNSKGEVIGIATLIVTEGQNLNFAIPSDKIIALKETSKATLSESYASLTADSNDAQSFYDKGLIELWQENWSDALTYFQKATEKNPDNGDAWFYVGYCYGSLGRQQEEIEAYKQTIRIKPDYAEAHYNLGVAYFNLGRYEESIEACKQAIRIKPDFALAHYNLGIAYLPTGDKGSALEEYKILKTLDAELANKLFNLISSLDANEIESKLLSENVDSSDMREPFLYHNLQGHFSFTLPSGWIEISKDTIEAYVKILREEYSYTSASNYDAAFQKTSVSPFAYPYVMLQIDKRGRWPENETKKLLSSDEWEKAMQQGVHTVDEQLPTLIQNSKVGQPIYDKEKNIVFTKVESEVTGVGKIVTLTAVILSNYGSVNLYCYSTENDFENDLPYFTQIVNSFRYDIGYEYNQFTKKSSDTASGSLLGIGLIVFICVGLVILAVIIVAKKSSDRPNNFPETSQTSVQPSTSAPLIQILEEENKVTKRSIFLRILFGFLWFIPIYLLSNMIIGGIVGAFAGASTKSFEEGYNAGRVASIDFFQKYGLLIFLAQVILTVILSVIGFLPGTRRYKKIKNIESDSLPSFGEEATPMVLASTEQRFGTMILDVIFYFIFAFIFGFVAALIGLGDLIQNMNDTVLGIIILIIYYVPQEAFFGRTLGKLITGTKAINKDGTNLTFGQALGRTLCRFIPFEAFSFLGGRGRPIGWHDKIPKTKVISLRRT